MGKSGCTSPYNKAYRRSTYTIHNETSPDIPRSKYNYELRNQEKLSYDTANKRYDRYAGFGKSRYQPQLPVNILSSSENRSDVSPNLQFKTAKQFCQTKEFSAFQPLSNAEFLTERRLDGEDRSEPCIFPPTRSRGAQTFSKAELQRTTTANDVPTFWPLVSTTNVHLSDKLDCRILESPQYKVCCLSRRFFVGESVQSGFTRTHCIHGKADEDTRLVYQHGQICTGSDTTLGVSGRDLGYQTQHEIPVGIKVPNATQGTSQSDVQRQLVPQTGPVPSGETQLCFVCSTQREVTLSDPTIPQQVPLQGTPLQTGEITRNCTFRNDMVVESGTRLSTNTYRPNLAPAYHRCFGLRLGCSAGRNETIRSVDETTTILACQSQRAIRCLRGDPTREPQASECTHLIANRQSHGRGLYQQRRRNEVEETSVSDTPTTKGDGPVEYLFNSTVLPGSIQWRGRCPITREGFPRVASADYSHKQHIQDVGNAAGRPIRIKDGSCSKELCICRHSRSGGTLSQRIPPPLGLQTRLGFSSSKPNTPGTSSTEHGERSLHFDSTEVEDGILACRPAGPSHSRPIPNPESTSSPNRHKNRNPSTRDTRNSFGSLADFGWTDEIKNWSVEERSLLMSSWRKSTINTYMPAWSKWKAWCVSNDTPYRSPNPEQVARYLAYLHNSEGLAYRTILVHKSVIATFTNISELSSNFFIKHILKAISVAKVKKKKPPIWNAKNVLQYLENDSPDENNLYQVSRRAAILLLLAAGRRVHDLTLLTIDADNFVDEGSAIVLWPCFGSKTDNVNYRQSGWRLKEHPIKNLDCVYWTRQLIKTSQGRRKSGTITNLFITARGESKPASRTVIGGWIKSVLKDAGVEASPGSVRSAVASLNWLEKFPIDQILETGNWRQEHTFRKYYQKELMADDITNSVSLSKFFESIR